MKTEERDGRPARITFLAMLCRHLERKCKCGKDCEDCDAAGGDQARGSSTGPLGGIGRVCRGVVHTRVEESGILGRAGTDESQTRDRGSSGCRSYLGVATGVDGVDEVEDESSGTQEESPPGVIVICEGKCQSRESSRENGNGGCAPGRTIHGVLPSLQPQSER